MQFERENGVEKRPDTGTPDAVQQKQATEHAENASQAGFLHALGKTVEAALESGGLHAFNRSVAEREVSAWKSILTRKR